MSLRRRARKHINTLGENTLKRINCICLIRVSMCSCGMLLVFSLSNISKIQHHLTMIVKFNPGEVLPENLGRGLGRTP